MMYTLVFGGERKVVRGFRVLRFLRGRVLVWVNLFFRVLESFDILF